MGAELVRRLGRGAPCAVVADGAVAGPHVLVTPASRSRFRPGTGFCLGYLDVAPDDEPLAAARTLQPTSIEVTALAAGQTLVSGRVAAGTPVGQGTLTVTLGTLTPDGQGGFGFAGSAAGVDIAIGASDDSVAGVAAAINRAKAGVTASVIDDGQGARLVLKGPTGVASAFIVTGDAGQGRFDYRPGSAAMASAGAARDAALTVDGVAVTRPTNTVTDLVPGVTLTLIKAVPGAPVTLSASRDTTGLSAALSDLVDAVNALRGLTATLTGAATDAGPAGALAGDPVVRQLGQVLAGLTASGGLGALGVSTARDGTLSIDQARLTAALAADPDGAEAALSRLTASSGVLARAKALLGTGTDAGLAREQAAVKSAQTTLDERTTTLRAGLVKQYAAMDTAVAGFKATQSFLDNQIKAWNRSSN